MCSICPKWISARWWLVFSVEPLLCLGTSLYIALDPEGYLGVSAVDAVVKGMTQQYASTIFSAYVLLLGLLLWTPSLCYAERRRCFAYIQVAMFVGDVCLVASALMTGSLSFTTVATVMMANFWGGLRLVYLFRGSRPATAGRKLGGLKE